MNFACNRRSLRLLVPALLALTVSTQVLAQDRWRSLDAPATPKAPDAPKSPSLRNPDRPNEQSRRVQRTIPLGTADGLSIENQFGDVVVELGGSNDISYTVEIVAWGRDAEAARRILNEIQIAEGQSDRTLTLRTDLPKLSNNSNNRGFQINYRVRMPSSTALRVKNKFGGIVVPDLKTPTRLESSYGSLVAGVLSNPDTYLEINFGSGDVRGVDAGEVKLSYGKYDFGSLGTVNLRQSFSNVRVNDAARLLLEAKFGDVKLGSLGSASGTASFSPITIQKLTKQLAMTVKHNNVEVDQISPDFEEIRLDGSYSNLRLRFARTSGFQLNADLSYGNLSYPRDEGFSMTHIEKDGSRSIYEGRYGSTGDGRMVLNTKYGNITLSRN